MDNIKRNFPHFKDTEATTLFVVDRKPNDNKV